MPSTEDPEIGVEGPSVVSSMKEGDIDGRIVKVQGLASYEGSSIEEKLGSFVAQHGVAMISKSRYQYS